MKRFFDFSPSIWTYFQQVDERFGTAPVNTEPATIDSYTGQPGTVRAVLWDVYGTLCGVKLGDLEKSLGSEPALEAAACATVAEFELTATLQRLYPDRTPATALRQIYVELIDVAHCRSRQMGIEYPEVVIEDIWQTIIRTCRDAGYQPRQRQPIRDRAYCWAYSFDANLQQTYLYPGAGDCLETIKNSGLIQGIISNAQFYTPIHLRRLLRRSTDRNDLELDDIFTEELVFFSYELGCSKPNPTAFERALDVLQNRGIAPHETIYVGNDMLNDIWAAQNSRMRTVLYAGDRDQTTLRTDDDRCRALRPDAIVTHMSEIAEQVLGVY